MTVIELHPGPKDDEYIYVCGCGSASFTLRGDGETICRDCNYAVKTSGPHKCWHMSPDSEVTSTQPQYNDGHNGADFTERRVKERVQDDEVTFVVFGRDTGSVTAWCRHFDMTADRADWLRDQVSTGIDMIINQKG